MEPGIDWQEIIELIVTVLGIVGAILGALGRKKYKDILKAVIVGVEAASDEAGYDVKRSITTKATAAVVEHKLNKLVKKWTEKNASG